MQADSVDPTSDSSSPAGGKLCRVCGKDTTGHRRIKDSLGYICVPCAKAKEKAELEGTVPCAECKRRMKPSGLVPYGKKMICRSCLKDHEEINRFRKPPPSGAGHKAHEKKRMLIMLGVLGILALIMVLSKAGVIGSPRNTDHDLSPAEKAARDAAQKNTQNHK